MKTLTFNGFEGTAELDVERSVCHGKILFVQDLVAYESDEIRGLQSAFEEAVKDYIETCEAIGKEPQRALRGSFNVRTSPQLHRMALVRAVCDGVTLNEVVNRSMDCYLNVRADVLHRVNVVIEDGAGLPKALQSVASGAIGWEKFSVH